MEISEDSKITTSAKLMYSFVGGLIVLVFGGGSIYSKHSDLPEKVEKIEKRIQRREAADKLNCKILKQIQRQVVPKNMIIEADCESVDQNE